MKDSCRAADVQADDTPREGKKGGSQKTKLNEKDPLKHEQEEDEEVPSVGRGPRRGRGKLY